MSIGHRLISVGGAAVFVAATSLMATAQGSGSIDATTELPCQASSWSFASTGTEQTFIVPAGVTSITATAIGAKGGNGGFEGNGGLGGTAAGNIQVHPGETFFLEVGTPGHDGSVVGGTAGASPSGGRGGGLQAGGGGSDFRKISASVAPASIKTQFLDSAASLNSRLVVVGGGGGFGPGGRSYVPGGSGGNVGLNGTGTLGIGGGQAGGPAGGRGGFGEGPSGLAGALRYGGDGIGDGREVDNGGGGWHGGGGGSSAIDTGWGQLWLLRPRQRLRRRSPWHEPRLRPG